MGNTSYMPVFTGGVFGNNEIVLPFSNYVFKSEEELNEANEERLFTDFFPVNTVFSRVLKTDSGFSSVKVDIAGTELLCISGDWYDKVE